MKAMRWILFCLLAFGTGTGVAFAVHPPTIGIPEATADGLARDLEKIRDYAADGRCYAVRGRLNGAQAKIQNLPNSTAAATVEQLQASLEEVRDAALTTCQRASEANAPAETTPTETTPETTPSATPEPTTPSEPTPTDTTPDLDGGAPDPGSDEAPTPEAPGNEGNGNGDGQGNNGGVTLPNGAAIRQRIDKERKRAEKELRDFQKALRQ